MHYDCSLRLNITDVYFRVCILTSSCHDTGNGCDIILERLALTYSYPVLVIQLITKDLSSGIIFTVMFKIKAVAYNCSTHVHGVPNDVHAVRAGF